MSESITRWRRIEALLDEALEQPASEAPAFLDHACGEDVALRSEVAELLRACEAAREYLEPPAAPERLGPYRVIQEAGRGGMGVVYAAERDDDTVRMRVALKLLVHRPGMERVGLQRFQRERQILASLEHPGIARLVDAGVTADGTPWFAMEYVNGIPIDRYCTERALDMQQCVALFASVCDAVAYAHVHGVVHRDIKPSNILVSADGRAKLLDFGIAKLVAHPSGDTTHPGVTPLTPDYASPEQLEGRSVSPASDVYALGMLLHVLLAGALPRASIAGAGVELSLPPAVPASIGAIVAAALRRDPALRYPTAGALAADVRACMAGTPLSTRPRVVPRGARFVSARVAVVAGAVAASIVASSVAVLRAHANRATDPTSAVAVIPLAADARDEALIRLGRDLAVALSADLDGMGDVRTVDAPALLARVGEGAPAPTLAGDVALARAIGAASMVRGTLARVGSRARATVTLRTLDASAAPLVRATVLVPLDDVAGATDSLRTQLLRGLWRVRGDVPNPAAVTSHNAAAVRAYVAGERAVRENRMPAASAEFARAIEADSTFWYAYWRMAWARAYMGRRVDARVKAAYLAHFAEFPERDRRLIQARLATSLLRKLALASENARSMPDYWPAWLDYADAVVAGGPYAGVPLADARQALDHALLLNPSLAPAWDARMVVALTELDTTAAARALAALEQLHYDSASRAAGGFEMLVYFRFLDRLARQSGVADAAETARIARMLAGDARPSEGRFVGGMSRYGFHAARIEIARHTLRLAAARRDHIAFEWGEAATTWASRGAWDSAMVAADRASMAMPGPERTLFAYRLAAVGLVLGELDAPTVLARRRFELLDVAALPPARQIELAWVNGVVAAVVGDDSALASARRMLARGRSPLAALADSSLLARQLDRHGDRARAVAVLRALVEGRFGPAVGALPYLGGVDRLLLSGWLREAGQTQAAARLLVWHEALVHDVQTAHANALLGGFAYLERARIEEAAGRREMALADYERFLRRYDRPSPARRRMVDDARAATFRLSARR